MEDLMTEEERLDALIRQTLDESTRPPEPPMEMMWADIERRAFGAPRIHRIPAAAQWHWRAPALAAAAALIMGTALGWSLAPRRIVTRVITAPAQATAAVPRTEIANPASSPSVANPESLPAETARSAVRTVVRRGSAAPVSRLAAQFNDAGGDSEMGRYLAQTSILLASLPSGHASAASDTTLATRASDLLTRTHLLLDSRAGSDPTLHRLLEDLELVLAQVARLRVEGNGTDLQMIHQAITTHDVLPRVHDASLEASITD
jgi:hypothetical protein